MHHAAMLIRLNFFNSAVLVMPSDVVDARTSGCLHSSQGSKYCYQRVCSKRTCSAKARIALAGEMLCNNGVSLT